MTRCAKCTCRMAMSAQGGEYCLNDCDRIPEPITDGFSNTSVLIDTGAVTRPFEEPCCKAPDLAPFELRDGEFGHHCWSCGKVLP